MIIDTDIEYENQINQDEFEDTAYIDLLDDEIALRSFVDYIIFKKYDLFRLFLDQYYIKGHTISRKFRTYPEFAA